MSLSIEQIKEAFTQNADLQKQVLLYVVETTEGKELLNNFAKKHFDENIGSKVSEIYNNIDNDIFETLGVRKDPNQKTYDFLKTTLTDYKKIKESQNTDKDKEINDLKEKLKTLETSTSNGEFWHKTHQEAVSKFEQEKNALSQKIQELENANLSNLVNNDLSMGLAGLKFSPNVPESAIQALTNSIKSDVMKQAKIVDGKVVYHKEDGNPWLDNEYKPISAKSIFAEKLKDVLDKPAGGGGAPTGKVGKIITIEGNDGSKKVVLDATKFGTQVEFFNHLDEVLVKENGVAKNSPEYAKLRDTAYAEYKVSEMKRV